MIDYDKQELKQSKEYIDSWNQHIDDINYIMSNLKDLPSECKPLVRRIIKEHPNWDGFFQFGFDGTFPSREELEDKIGYYDHLLALLESNLEFDLGHSNIPEDIDVKKERIFKLMSERAILAQIMEYENG